MLHRAGAPSPSWRSFLRNHVDGIAAIDIFVVASALFRLLYVMVILGHNDREIVRFDVTQHPDRRLAIAPADREYFVGYRAALSAARP